MLYDTNSLVTFSGSRIFYDRSFLLQCRNSPLTRSPPPNMAKIPGVTAPGEVDIPKENGVVGDASQEKKGKVLSQFIPFYHSSK